MPHGSDGSAAQRMRWDISLAIGYIVGFSIGFFQQHKKRESDAATMVPHLKNDG